MDLAPAHEHLGPPPVRVVAVLAVRNESRFLGACLANLIGQGVQVYVCDNGSTDDTFTIAERHLGAGVIGVERLAFDGTYRWEQILERKEALFQELDADWVMHVDADEIHLPPLGWASIPEALAEVGARGYDAVEFDEFTFVPTVESPDHDHSDFVNTLRTYYPFRPRSPHCVRAYRKQPGPIEIAWSGGHMVRFAREPRLFPTPFRMRHYLFLSREHAALKYAGRQYSAEEVDELGWHGWRSQLRADDITLPSTADGLRTTAGDDDLDASNPWTQHWLDQGEGIMSAPPKVLAIADRPGWAIDRKALNLQRVLAGRYDITIRYQREVTEADLQAADLVMIFYWLETLQMELLPEGALERCADRLVMGVCSHYELAGDRRDPGLALLNSLPRAVNVISRLLEQECAPVVHAPLHYTPNGVDTSFFTPASQPRRRTAGELHVGWAGSLGNMGAAQRGFHDVIEPAVAAVPGAVLHTAIREQQWRTAAEMVEWYRDLDVYVCASIDEGTPNPCMEAAACGIPVITSRVGVMPELIEDGVNGYFHDGTAEGLAARLTVLRDSPSLTGQLGARIRTDIAAWDWSHLAERYAQMFESVLGDRQPPQNRRRRTARTRRWWPTSRRR